MAEDLISSSGRSTGYMSVSTSRMSDAQSLSSILHCNRASTESVVSDLSPANKVEDVWYLSIFAELNYAWYNLRELWRRRDLLRAIWLCVCLPFRVIFGAASFDGDIKIPSHSSVCYLFLFMCYTLVLNLVKYHDRNTTLQQVFIVSSMVIAIPAMLYIYLFSKDHVLHDPQHNSASRIFSRGGLYIFGFVSMFNSICMAIDDLKCGFLKFDRSFKRLPVTVQVLKVAFIACETLFLAYFHKARFFARTPLLQIFLAHILGTNLLLWFWTLCEESRMMNENSTLTCNSTANKPLPLNWQRHQEYFYPIFIEYVILAISILYWLWTSIIPERPQNGFSYMRIALENVTTQREPRNFNGNPSSNVETRMYIPRCGFGLLFGSIYVAVFLAFMLWAIFHSSDHQKPNHIPYDSALEFKLYCWASVSMYTTMIFSCYIILVSLNLLNASSGESIREVDYEDVLLYISFFGILLLEGFHLVSKIITTKNHLPPFHLIAVDVSATFQHATQIVTLMTLSHKKVTATRRARVWICECILFLLLTNLAWWIEDTFYLPPKLTRPGEIRTIHGIDAYGTIVKPMVIFFRFHSATYFYNAWSEYRS